MNAFYPSQYFLYALGGCCILGLLTIVVPELGSYLVGTTTLLLFITTGIDYLLTPNLRADLFQLDFPDQVGVGLEKTLSINWHVPEVSGFASGAFPLTAQLFLESDSSLGLKQHFWNLQLQESSSRRISTSFVPVDRTLAEVGPLKFRYRSRFGLLVYPDQTEPKGEIHVMPEVKDFFQNSIKADQISEFVSGLKKQNQRAQEGEFDSLTEYRVGMDPRKIDWMSSARQFRMLARNYKLEQNHQIYLGLDVGRLMGTRYRGIKKLDHAINAALRFAYFALRSGDRVGLFAFDDEVVELMKAQGGPDQFPRLVKRANQLSHRIRETNYLRAFRRFCQFQKQRSLVVVFTDFVDRVSATLSMEALSFVAKDHVVVYVACSDPELESECFAPPKTVRELHRKNEMFRLKQEREEVLREMRSINISTIDVDLSDLTIPLLNRYLELKRTQRL